MRGANCDSEGDWLYKLVTMVIASDRCGGCGVDEESGYNYNDEVVDMATIFNSLIISDGWLRLPG